MKQRPALLPGTPSEQALPRAGNSPVIVLSYAYSRAPRVQEALADGTALACTAGTGIIPLCEAAAETWRRVEGRPGQAPSRLGVATLRGLITAQVTVILAAAGKTRWCELATTTPKAAESFLQVFPETSVVCVHRSSLDVIGAGVRANPWGLQGLGLTPYLLAYPGNSVAALAAYWADSTEELLAFETSNPHAAYRVRYEDVAADPGQALATVRACLGLDDGAQKGSLPEPANSIETPTTETSPPEPTVPTEMIPNPLHERINHLHAELGYPRLGHVRGPGT